MSSTIPDDEALALIDDLLHPWNTGHKVHPGYEGIGADHQPTHRVASWNARRRELELRLSPHIAAAARLSTSRADAYADRLETAAQVLHSHRHRLGWAAVCGRCRRDAAAVLAIGAVR